MISKSELSLELECWVEELSPAQLAAYDKVAIEHTAIKNALKNALSVNEGKELFNGQVFQAYSFKGKVLQELKEATIPKKKSETPSGKGSQNARKRSNLVYLESSDEEDDDIPLAKRIAIAGTKGAKTAGSAHGGKGSTKNRTDTAGHAKDVGQTPKSGKAAKETKSSKSIKTECAATLPPPNFKPSEDTSVGGLLIGADNKDGKSPKENKEMKLQGKTFPSLVVLAKPWLKVKDMSATRNKLDAKVKLVLMLTPNKFTEWLIQEGLLKAEQRCSNHKNSDLKLGVYSDASKFPYTGGYVWISECCPTRFVSVFHGSIFEGAPHPPSCILKLIYHWACQTNIQNVVQWVKVDNVYVKGVYTWLRAVCTLAVHQKCKQFGGEGKYVEVGVISFGTTSQDGQQRTLKVEVLGVLDVAEKSIRLRAVEPLNDNDRNYKKRFQVILEPLQRWVHKDSILCIDLTIDKMTLHQMGFKNIIQASVADNNAKHTNAGAMDYLRRIVPRMFQNTLSLLSRQMIQQFLDELVWREQFGTYALQAFNSITQHISEQTRLNTNESLTQRLYHVATNPFKDWSVIPPNIKETPPHTAPKRLKKPINEADYINMHKVNLKAIKKEREDDMPIAAISGTGGSGGGVGVSTSSTSTKKKLEENKKATSGGSNKHSGSSSSGGAAAAASKSAKTSAALSVAKSQNSAAHKKHLSELKMIKKEKEEDELKGLEEMYYGIQDGYDEFYEKFPYVQPSDKNQTQMQTDGELGQTSTNINDISANNDNMYPVLVECPICDTAVTFESNVKLQMHLLSHITVENNDTNNKHQCIYCLEKKVTEIQLNKHKVLAHPMETKHSSSPSYRCLLCQQRFNSLNFLTSHLQNKHSLLELPFYCQACSYRTSSHRDIINHFYEHHQNHNFLQCPHCLDIYRFSYKGRISQSNIENFYMHLRQHLGKKEAQLKCQKCALYFVDKGSLKQHLAHHHSSLFKQANSIRPLIRNSMLVQPPKIRSHHRDPLPFNVHMKLGEFYAFIDGSICAECNTEIISERHFTGLLKCNKCNYKTFCERAMFQHGTDCSGINDTKDIMEMPMANEMHCICGFSTGNGNTMALHLVHCGQKSAYSSLAAAQENTVKRNMLDMLGLVKKDGEQGNETEGESSRVVMSEDVVDDGVTVNDVNCGNAGVGVCVGGTGSADTATVHMPVVADVVVDDNNMAVMQQQQQQQLQQHQQQQQTSEAAIDLGGGRGDATMNNAHGNVINHDDTNGAPIQFGQMDATPQQHVTDVADPQQQQQQQHYAHLVDNTSHLQTVPSTGGHPQYHLGFGQAEVAAHTLNAADIDMPLIGELADPNPPPTPQFLGEVHTPMFDAVAAAEQQHYHQLMQQQQQQHLTQQHPHHHGAQ